MNQNDFSNLRFDRTQRPIPGRVLWMVGLLAGVGLVWVIMPPGAFFWLIFLLVGVLGWASSYGWRQAVRVLSSFLDRIETL